MKSGLILRILLALLITLSAAYYQRKTGPTHPLEGEIKWLDTQINYKLLRSHGGEGDQPVNITVPDKTMDGYLVFRRYKTGEHWKAMKMKRQDDDLLASLPNQPAAGKIEYYIILTLQDEVLYIPQYRWVLTRFTVDVPGGVLFPHIIMMFLAMLFSNMAGLEALIKGKYMYKFSIWAAMLLFMGGMILGPIVQKYAFDAFWTGFPLGLDLTDNKTFIAMIAWLIALWKGRNNRQARGWILGAAVVMLLIYLIPHSMFGSELDYQTMQVGTGD
jgi:hypothetical protein